MLPIPWTVIALGLSVATGVSLVANLLLERAAKHYPFYARFVAAISALVGCVVITVAANPSTIEDPALAGLRVALSVVLALQIAKLVVEGRRRNVA